MPTQIHEYLTLNGCPTAVASRPACNGSCSNRSWSKKGRRRRGAELLFAVYSARPSRQSLARKLSVLTPMGTGRRGQAREPACARKSNEDTEYDLSGDPIADDYYSILGLTPDATQEEIKKAYYACMKVCHPDLSGDNDETTDFCMFINEIYEVLSDPVQRMVYDEINGYSLTSTNPFMDVKTSRDYAFVDEFTCIGCKNCANTAPLTFQIEEEYGRARVACQSGDRSDLVQQAIETCPVDCIYWVSAAQLSLLEDEMRRAERVNVGLMLSGMGTQGVDLFARASRRWQKRQARAVERARIRSMMENNKNASSPWWQDVLNKSLGEDGVQAPAGDDTGREKAAKAAAAARRWREYSRKGVDRKPIYNLPAFTGKESEEPEMAQK